MKQQNSAAIIALHTRLLTLKLLPRIGWLQRGQAHVESIAEHSFSLATLALFVADQIPDLDRGKVVVIALLHDLAEALVGDLPFTARRLIGADRKQEAERQGMIELLCDLPHADEYLALWNEYAHCISRESRLVKQLDRVEMLSQALAYERAGNRAMEEFWQNIDQGWSDEFPIVIELVQQLVKERHAMLAPVYAPLPASHASSDNDYPLSTNGKQHNGVHNT